MKDNIQKYGWVVVVVIVLSILIALATPFSMAIKNAVVGTINKMDEIRQDGEDYTFPYTVKLKTNIPEAGTVEFTGDYSGTSVELRGEKTLTFTATENPGYIFLGWYVGDTLISESAVFTTGYTVNAATTITAKYEVGLVPGLYDANDEPIASWSDLVNVYGMDVTKDYTSSTYKTDVASPYYVLTNTTELTDGTKLVVGDVGKIGQYAFYDCDSLTSVTIPNSVTSFGTGVFYNCSNLTSVTIPDNTTEIARQMFYLCEKLTNINIPANVKRINSNAFSYCRNLPSINIPSNTTNFVSDAFYSCTNLKAVYYEGTLEQWCQITFNTYQATPCCNGADLYIGGVKQTDIIIPDTISKIKNYTFQGCTSLTKVIIPNNTTDIGDAAFRSCTNLADITISANTTNIGDGAFSGCTNLNTVYYKGNLEQWCQLTFINAASNPCCNGANLYINDVKLTELIIPNTITEIKNYTFYKCESLTSVTIPEGITNIDNYAFSYCSNLVNINIPDGVTSIGNYAFYSCASLASISIPNGVTSIGNSAFYECSSLTNITIPDSVIAIGKEAFSKCENLTGTIYNNAIYLGSENNPYLILHKAVNTSITSCEINEKTRFITEEAFKKCTALTSISIPTGITNISKGAFETCTSLTNITIPNGVTSISDRAFYNCPKLANITFEGTTSEWKAITFGSNWNKNFPSNYIITCTNGTINKSGTVTLFSE